MKRLPLLLFLAFTLSTGFFGCLAGPGVDTPNAKSDGNQDQTGTGGTSAFAQDEDVAAAGASSGEPAAGGTTTTTSATGGTGGTGIVTMDASAADGGAPMDSGTGTGDSAEVQAEAGYDDDAGSEQ